jgi:hypothetical protein
MISQDLATAGAIAALLVPLLLITSVLQFWLNYKKRHSLETALTTATQSDLASQMALATAQDRISILQDAAEKAIRIGRGLQAQNEELEGRLISLQGRFGPIVELDSELSKIKSEIQQHIYNLDEIRQSYQDKKEIYDKILKESSDIR